MYCPYKSKKIALSRNDANWNIIQSLIMMCVERVFGILKDKWRLIKKRSKVPFRNMFNIVVTNISIT
jgi:hypothetical protein